MHAPTFSAILLVNVCVCYMILLSTRLIINELWYVMHITHITLWRNLHESLCLSHANMCWSQLRRVFFFRFVWSKQAHLFVCA